MYVFDLTLYDIGRQIGRWVWRPLRQTAQVVHPIPLLSALSICFLLALTGQLHEIYFSYLEPPLDPGKAAQMVLALASLALVSAALFFANYRLSTTKIDVIYTDSANHEIDMRLRFLRNMAGLIAAFLPWAGLTLGLHTAAGRAGRNVDQLNQAMAPLAARLDDVASTGALLDLLERRLSFAMVAVLLGGVAIAGLLNAYRQNRALLRTVLTLTIIVFAAMLVIPAVLSAGAPDSGDRAALRIVDAVSFFRSLGPMAMAVLLALCLFATLALLSLLSGQTGFPILALAFVSVIAAALLQLPIHWVAWSAIAIFGVVAILGLLSRHFALAALAGILVLFSFATAWQLDGSGATWVSQDRASPPPSTPGAALKDSFKDWTDARRDDIAAYERSRGKKFPVFIVSAQGGGIYAAAAAAAFLSRLQDHCPRFANHVFAISGVSGGAVGAAVFEGMLKATRANRTECSAAAATASGSLSTRTSGVVLDDHLSPLLGTLLADLLGLHPDRALALEQSFVRSMHERGAGALGAPFREHWHATDPGPALLLNATWVETGYRVAFAPFSLGGMRDGTLYAFGDPKLASGRSGRISLAGAAVVSARFPGIVPAFSFTRPVERGGQLEMQRWNFVDGGYADESGSATALEVYKELQDAGKTANVDLRLVLLTSARPEPDFDQIKGTVARDVLTPALTLLSVRDLLSKQAVMRTISEVETTNPGAAAALQRKESPAQLGETDNWRATVVELDHESFTLALGWKISSATYQLVSLLMGRPELCTPRRSNGAGEAADIQEEADKGRQLRISTKTIRANSCVMRAISEMVAPAR
jgi:hypothetical protein